MSHLGIIQRCGPLTLGVALLIVYLSTTGTLAEPTQPPTELAGLWRAKKNFGPGVEGPLTLEVRNRQWRAEIAGFSMTLEETDGEIRFELPGGRGGFIGRVDGDRQTVTGHWIQPPLTQIYMQMASPVRFERIGPKRWRGEVIPRESEYTFYLVIRERDDGTVGAFLRNPDRNLGLFLNLDRVVRDGDHLEFIGNFFRNENEEVLLRGLFDADHDRFSVFFSPSRGGTYDFERVDADEASAFFARGKNPDPWVYRSPSKEADGWPVSTLEAEGIDVEPIKRMIEQEIDLAADHVGAHYVHAILIARHGKLVLEEYFHGFHRNEPHDTRSASKSLTSLLTGAAIEAGMLSATEIPVYETIYGELLEESLDPRKRRMTLEHLLTMSSGFYCDDADSEAPGNEDVMQEQDEEPDWYRYTLVLPMVSEPGDTAVYCSVNSNLIGKVLISATGQSLPELVETLIAKPLDIQRYYLGLQPTGEPYMGGGIHWWPRDFMKLGQVVLNGGTWNGKRVVSEEWARRSTSALYDLRERKYGYLWWVIDYPYKDRMVRAFYAGGNGGQVVIGIPELDLLIAFFGGNYSDPVLYRSQEVLVPRYILEAVDDTEN